jgi:hypothetical protein
MKNVHLIPTDKPSRLHLAYSKDYYLSAEPFIQLDTKNYKSFNIYITSDEEIDYENWACHKNITKDKYQIVKCNVSNKESIQEHWNKIILTTDPELIADGVQAIDDEFLEWFGKNQSCEYVEIKEKQHFEADKSKRINPLNGVYYSYKIIIPQEEPIQLTVGKEFYESADKNITVYKQDIIQLIEDRILSEYKKHSASLPNEWAKIAAYKIYKSISNQTDDIYIGSTCQLCLSKQFTGHKRSYADWKKGNTHHVTAFGMLKHDDCARMVPH